MERAQCMCVEGRCEGTDKTAGSIKTDGTQTTNYSRAEADETPSFSQGCS